MRAVTLRREQTARGLLILVDPAHPLRPGPDPELTVPDSRYPAVLLERRAAGLLGCARRMSGQEAESLLSDLRLGVSTGILAGVEAGKLNQLIYQIKPACLETAAGQPLAPEQRDEARAALLRQALAGIKEGE